MNSSPTARRGFARMRIGLLASAVWPCCRRPALRPRSPMVTGGLTSQPIGHYEFCKANPDECSIRPAISGPSA